MAKLQRPPTIKEFVIQSILCGRDFADTLVDREEQVSGADVDSDDRATAVDPLPPAREALGSVVFDLASPPAWVFASLSPDD